MITILKSDTADLPAGSKLSLLDADDLLLRRNPGSVEYQIQFLLRGKEKVQNAVIDLSKLSGTGTFADSIVGDASFAPSSVDYLKSIEIFLFWNAQQKGFCVSIKKRYEIICQCTPFLRARGS